VNDDTNDDVDNYVGANDDECDYVGANHDVNDK
jgi:hypothetical protein